jgi:acyl-coenzyme A synthetase/AMP-(fatty) acid ligase
MKDNTARLVLGSLLRDPDKTVMGDDSTSLNRSSILANVQRQVHAMQADKIAADEFVVLVCDRGLSFWIELLAAWVIGAKPICVEAKLPDGHALSIVEMTNVTAIFGATEQTTEVFSALKRLKSTFDPTLVSGPIRETFDSLPFASDDALPDIAGLIFTSGTTGLPKGVPLTHKALNANALATVPRLNLRQDSRLLIATPFRFISSISHFLVTLLSGAAFFGVERPIMIKDLLNILNEQEITAFGGSPFHLQFIAMAGKERLPSLKWAMSSGDHLRPAVIDQLMEKFDDLELHVVYGMAELGGRFCELPTEALSEKKGSVGYPISGFEIAIRRDDGSHCEANEIGNIYVTGLLEFKGYFANPEANAKVIGPLGFLNGDKGYFDETGYLFLSGRSDAVFKRSGLKVSAQVINDAIMELSSIKDVYVSSEENDAEGRVPIAYVCWEHEQDLAAPDITRALRKLIPVNHIPVRYVTLPVIPRTGSGKVDRRALNKMVLKAT